MQFVEGVDDFLRAFVADPVAEDLGDQISAADNGLLALQRIMKAGQNPGHRRAIRRPGLVQHLEQRGRRESPLLGRQPFEDLFGAVKTGVAGQQSPVGRAQVAKGAPRPSQDLGLSQRRLRGLELEEERVELALNAHLFVAENLVRVLDLRFRARALNVVSHRTREP